MNIDALLLSMEEPQITRCIQAIKDQTVPFANIIHIINVVPECVAFNKGLDQVSSEWFMHIAGDFVLYENALEQAISYMASRMYENTCAFHFGLHDTFLDCVIGFCSILRSSIYKSIRYGNKLSNDRNASFDLRRRGWRTKKKLNLVLGTHFDKPDEFQVFRRFYTQWIKYPNNQYVKERLTELFQITKDPLYTIGLQAGQFADKKKVYPGSHNIDFDKQLYEEFKANGKLSK